MSIIVIIIRHGLPTVYELYLMYRVRLDICGTTVSTVLYDVQSTAQQTLGVTVYSLYLMVHTTSRAVNFRHLACTLYTGQSVL